MVRSSGSGRLLATVLGVAALVIGAFLKWIGTRTGDKLTLHALVQTNFGGTNDIVRTVGGFSILIAIVAVVGLVDATGWLTRLAGSAALVVFVLFAVEAYRYFGHDVSKAARDVGPGVWFELAGGLVVLIAGALGSRTTVVATEVDESAETLVKTRR